MVSLVLLLAAPAQASEMQLLDSDFAAQVCDAWNASSLPESLGRNGSGWIDGAGSPGAQVIVVSRRDCDSWAPVSFRFEADAKGDATCVRGGHHGSGDAYQWKFTPTTLQWADFPDGFGTWQMPGLMNGFVGPYGEAMKNIGNFGTFFAVVGKVALAHDVDWTCDGADAKKVARYVSALDPSEVERLAR